MNYSISTIGSGALFKTLFESPNFRVTVVGDSDTVEICGALKNIVAVGAGFIDGMKCGDNTKAAVIRIGLMEMIRYCKVRIFVACYFTIYRIVFSHTF